MFGIRRNTKLYAYLQRGWCIALLLLTLGLPGESLLGETLRGGPLLGSPHVEQLSAVAPEVVDYSDTAVQGVAERPLQANGQLNSLVRGARNPASPLARLGGATALAAGFFVPTHRSLFDLRIALRL